MGYVITLENTLYHGYPWRKTIINLEMQWFRTVWERTINCNIYSTDNINTNPVPD